MDALRTIDDLDVEGRRVLLRADLDVPLSRPSADGRRVTDDRAIRAAVGTIDELRRRGARIVLVSHLDCRTATGPPPSLRPVAARLAELTRTPVPLAPAVVGPDAHAVVARLAAGEVAMLENVCFEPGELRNDPALSDALAELADAFVNDAFAVAHRPSASTEGVAHRLPSAAGRLMQREVSALYAISRATPPLVAILGGAILSDKAGVVRRFVERADAVCVGGAMCFAFLVAQGHGVGLSLCPRGDVGSAESLLGAARRSGCRLMLPQDLVLAEWDAHHNGIPARVLDGVDVPERSMALDIGPETARRYAREIAGAATVFWDGPMGRFELAPFAAGTRAVADAIASAPATTVVSGGETVQALRSFGLGDRVGHVSTGHAATLQFLEGRALPGVRALLTKRDAGRLTGAPADLD